MAQACGDGVRVCDLNEVAALSPQDFDACAVAVAAAATMQSFRIEDTEQRNVYAFSEKFEPHFKGLPAQALRALADLPNALVTAGSAMLARFVGQPRVPRDDGPLFATPAPTYALPALAVDLPAAKPLPAAVAQVVEQGHASVSNDGERRRVQLRGMVGEALAAELVAAKRSKQREAVTQQIERHNALVTGALARRPTAANALRRCRGCAIARPRRRASCSCSNARR